MNVYTFADQCERQDFQSNLSRSHCVLITGKIIHSSILDKIQQSCLLYLKGLHSKDFPRDAQGQAAKAMEVMKVMVTRVLGREEAFTLSVRKGSQTLRYAKDSAMLLLPPIEVCSDCTLIIRDFLLYSFFPKKLIEIG
jgi:hypothetical protein